MSIINILLNRADINVNLQNNNGKTALMLAITYNKLSIVEQLLDKTGIDVNLQDKHGDSALMLAIKFNMKDIVDKLLTRTDINVNLQNNGGYTILMLAIKNKDIVEKILKKPNINFNLQNIYGDTILMLLIESNYEDIIIKLLERSDIDININLQNTDGFTALMYAIKNDFTNNKNNIAKQLLKRSDIDVNLQNTDGFTALMYAIKNDFTNIAIQLLERSDIDVNLQNTDGFTALMFAIWSYNYKIIDELLKKTIIILNLKSIHGKTALDLCKERHLPPKYVKDVGYILGRYLKYNLPEFIDYINQIIRKSANNNSNINNKVCDDIIKYLKDNYNLITTNNNSTYTIKSKKNEELLTVVDIFNSNKNNFYKKIINVEYRNKKGSIAGINAGGLTRNFFFECQQQLIELFKDYISNETNNRKNRINNVITERPSNLNKILYHSKLKKSIVREDHIIIVYLLIFSKINNCPIYLDKDFFGGLSEIILNLIIISDKYSLIQKIFIINMLQKYKDIFEKKLHYGMYDLLLTDNHRNNIVNTGKYDKKNVIATYISEINKVTKIKRNAKNKENMNKKMTELRNNINKNNNKRQICLLIDNAIQKGIYKDYIDFYYTHFIPDIITFEVFMKNLNFYNNSDNPVTNPEIFKDKIIKLLNYMNKKDNKNILLLAQAMTGNTLTAPTYRIDMYRGGDNLPVFFHTCFNSVDFFEGIFNYNITENEEENKEALQRFMEHIDLAIKGNFVG